MQVQAASSSQRREHGVLAPELLQLIVQYIAEPTRVFRLLRALPRRVLGPALSSLLALRYTYSACELWPVLHVRFVTPGAIIPLLRDAVPIFQAIQITSPDFLPTIERIVLSSTKIHIALLLPYEDCFQAGLALCERIASLELMLFPTAFPMARICTFLAYLPDTMERLTLRWSPLMDVHELDMILDAIVHINCRCLRIVSAYDPTNACPTSVVLKLATYIETHPIERLYLEGFQLLDDASRVLCRALHHCPTLQKVHFRGLSDVFMTLFVTQPFAGHRLPASLRCIKLFPLQLNAATMEIFQQTLATSQLTAVNLQFVRLSQDGWQLLWAALAQLRTLLRLHLDGIQFQSLLEWNSMVVGLHNLPRLQHLRLDVGLTLDGGAVSLANPVEAPLFYALATTQCNLTYLALCYVSDLELLAAALTHMPQLEELVVDFVSNTAQVATLLRLVQASPTLLRVAFHEHAFSMLDLVSLFQQLVAANVRWVYLDLFASETDVDPSREYRDVLAIAERLCQDVPQ
ncbi:hypothetical protein SPRG_04573 [Saprolegnia parasitica CBS 223.65]|uniref:Uncharacterized protein n=1 Tax=Saprolegnia parasitica (strain CBS 223.65) TaxID=695850 RepID=A0A067CV93_SAPPC|nr:hypothetical protein SPRG_04573 [Saprolegnia parasitica CBS 223.65]KDO30672.1 hypothetical protein SPRG_04573 [Saprolegnia parasitica CBS 223.65]|eukprot:XP_012198376.1 hypothetical protein SPRG_04573 [Saprolegnia parasitica CBS 223.65]